jgi:hypothetical protein
MVRAFKLPVVPAQSMMRDLEIVTGSSVLLLSAHEISPPTSAFAAATTISHGEDCEHVLPEPNSEKKYWAAMLGCACRKTTADTANDVTMRETLMGNLSFLLSLVHIRPRLTPGMMQRR